MNTTPAVTTTATTSPICQQTDVVRGFKTLLNTPGPLGSLSLQRVKPSERRPRLAALSRGARLWRGSRRHSRRAQACHSSHGRPASQPDRGVATMGRHKNNITGDFKKNKNENKTGNAEHFLFVRLQSCRTIRLRLLTSALRNMVPGKIRSPYSQTNTQVDECKCT